MGQRGVGGTARTKGLSYLDAGLGPRGDQGHRRFSARSHGGVDTSPTDSASSPVIGGVRCRASAEKLLRKLGRRVDEGRGRPLGDIEMQKRDAGWAGEK